MDDMHNESSREGYTTITIWQHWAKLRGDSDWLNATGPCPVDRSPMPEHPGFSIDDIGNVWVDGKAKPLSRIGRGRAYVNLGGTWRNWRTLLLEHRGIDL